MNTRFWEEVYDSYLKGETVVIEGSAYSLFAPMECSRWIAWVATTEGVVKRVSPRSNGVVPPEWRDRLVDNAKFVYPHY